MAFLCAFDAVKARFESPDNFTLQSAARMSDFHDQTGNRLMKRAVKEKQTICAIIFPMSLRSNVSLAFTPHFDMHIQCLLRLLLLPPLNLV